MEIVFIFLLACMFPSAVVLIIYGIIKLLGSLMDVGSNSQSIKRAEEMIERLSK